METNRETGRSIITKGDLAVQDMIDNKGTLQPERASQFMDLAIKRAVLLQAVDSKPLKAQVAEIPKIGFTSRIARRGIEGRSLSEGDRAKATLDATVISTVKIKCQVNLNDDELDDNIEGSALADHIQTLMAAAFSRDMEDLAINGDVDSPDELLSLTDGIFKRATSHTVDDTSTVLAQSHLFHLVNALPDEFQQDKTQMRIYLAPTLETKWRDIMSARVTGLGDSAIVSAAPIPAYGVRVEPIPLFPTKLGAGSNESAGLFLDPLNICFGIWRGVKYRTQEDIEAGVLKIVGTARVGVNFHHEPAVAKLVKIRAS